MVCKLVPFFMPWKHGYIYRYWHYHTNESSKEIYKQATVKVMKQNYEKFYMMTSEEVIELLKETK